MKTLIVTALLVASGWVHGAGFVFIETPTSRYALEWCAFDYVYTVRHGSRFESRGECKQALVSPQQPAWQPTPHPDGWVPAFDSHVSFEPVGAFYQCELIDYRRSDGLELIMLQCLDDPARTATRSR